jgi:hypothetical protein
MGAAEERRRRTAYARERGAQTRTAHGTLQPSLAAGCHGVVFLKYQHGRQINLRRCCRGRVVEFAGYLVPLASPDKWFGFVFVFLSTGQPTGLQRRIVSSWRAVVRVLGVWVLKLKAAESRET